MAKNYISNSTESTRIFNNSIFESLSRVHFSVPVILYLPIIVYLTYKAFGDFQRMPISYSVLFGSGLIVWSLAEYLLHRYVFHFTPHGKIMHRVHFIFHGVHHDFPKDRLRLVMPPPVSIPLALLFYFIFSLFLNEQQLRAFFPGFLLGYLIYDIGHYAIHHYNFKSGLMKKVKQHHMLHHYKDATKGYGVSTWLWDNIFRSHFQE